MITIIYAAGLVGRWVARRIERAGEQVPGAGHRGDLDAGLDFEPRSNRATSCSPLTLDGGPVEALDVVLR